VFNTTTRGPFTWDAKEGQAYTFRKPSGIDPHELTGLTDRFGTVDRARAAEHGYETVTCSFFEQVQGHSTHFLDAREVLQNVDSRMTAAFGDVHERAERDKVPLRDAAYVIAVERVAHACRERGWV
jgi:hypothetical protein